ncbi:MAG: site-2 protease family protein [Crenarchaeota archaeon]|nr:site-2 protease family protein [Thermoproteota archaeon]
MNGVLLAIVLYVLITTMLAMATRGEEIRVFGRRLVFTIAGFLIYLGGERRARRRASTPKPLAVAMVGATLVGIALFYTQMLPLMIRTVAQFIGAATGVSHAAPQPTVIPLPLVFTYSSIIPYVLIGLGIAVVAHETMHAIIALREGVSVRSWGVGVVALIPLAFVEVDEQEFNSSPKRSRAAVLSAGPFANAVIALATLAIFVASSHALAAWAQPAIVIQSIDCSVCVGGCPARSAGLQPGDIIAYINGSPIHSFQQLKEAIERAGYGGKLLATLCSPSGECRNVSIVLSAWFRGSNRPCIGVELRPGYAVFENGVALIPPQLSALVQLVRASFFTFIINYSLFVFNAIPLIITDGSKLLRVLAEGRPRLEKLFASRAFDIVNAVVIGAAMAVSTYLILVGA